MLEVIRLLEHEKPALSHPVIFLFNGAEENFMQVGGRQMQPVQLITRNYAEYELVI
jgi:hypothetical protein